MVLEYVSSRVKLNNHMCSKLVNMCYTRSSMNVITRKVCEENVPNQKVQLIMSCVILYHQLVLE